MLILFVLFRLRVELGCKAFYLKGLAAKYCGSMGYGLCSCLKEKPRLFGRSFFISSSIVADWAKLPCMADLVDWI